MSSGEIRIMNGCANYARRLLADSEYDGVKFGSSEDLLRLLVALKPFIRSAGDYISAGERAPTEGALVTLVDSVESFVLAFDRNTLDLMTACIEAAKLELSDTHFHTLVGAHKGEAQALLDILKKPAWWIRL